MSFFIVLGPLLAFLRFRGAPRYGRLWGSPRSRPSAASAASRRGWLDTGDTARLYSTPEAGHIGFAFSRPRNRASRYGLLAPAFPAEPAAAFTSGRWSILTCDGRDHEDRSHRCRGDQSRHRTQESIVFLHCSLR